MTSLLDWNNNTPFLAFIIELLVSLVLFFLSIMLTVRYSQRKNKVILYLFLSMIAMAFAVGISAAGKYLDFYSIVTREDKSYTDFTIAIAYCMTAVANVWASRFYTSIFEADNTNRPIIFGLLNFITIGLILPEISFELGVYDKILLPLAFHIVVSFLIYRPFFIKGFEQASKTKDRISSIGFKLIGLYGLFVISTFAFFIIDLIAGILTGGGYTPFYYAGWISVGLALICAYFGYIMPKWFKDLIEKGKGSTN